MWYVNVRSTGSVEATLGPAGGPQRVRLQLTLSCGGALPCLVSPANLPPLSSPLPFQLDKKVDFFINALVNLEVVDGVPLVTHWCALTIFPKQA